MTIMHRYWFLLIATVFCMGFGDSVPQPWENSESQSSASKPAAKPDDVANNTLPGDETSAAADNPHGTPVVNPHGDIGPHAGVPAASEGASAVIENDGKLDAETAHWTAPKSWVRKQPKPSIVQTVHVQTVAEYAIPKANGDEDDARLTVTQASGTLQGNVARWKNQFGQEPDGKGQETIDVSGVKVTLVDLSGTFQDSRGMMAPAIERPDYRMLGAILQIPNNDDLTFIKCYGPAKTMAARADEVKAFIRSMKVDK